MKIKMLTGIIFNGKDYFKGEIYNVDDDFAKELIARGRAEEVVEKAEVKEDVKTAEGGVKKKK